MKKTPEQLKVEGQDLVEGNNLGWVETMRQIAKKRSKRKGHVSADDIRKYCSDHDYWPLHPNAFGAVFRGKNWKEIGRTKSQYPSNHAREIRIWQWVDA